MVNDTANTTKKYRLPDLSVCSVLLKKTRSSQSGDSPNRSLECLGFEGTWSLGIKAFRRQVQEGEQVQEEQWPHLTKLIY